MTDLADELIVEDRDAIRILTINRPDRANAISPSLSRALAEAFLAAEDDDTIRVILLTATGDRHFSGGMDLKIRQGEDAAHRPMPKPMRGQRRLLYEIILETWKPTIAVLNGVAVGAGLELALACDMRIAAEHVTVALPEAKRGLGAHFGTILLPRSMPSAVAFEMQFTGEPLGAQRAYDVGLFNRLAPRSGALAVAMELARTIAVNAPISLRRIKETAVRSSGLPLATALRLNEGDSPYDSEDRREGIQAFVERRPPMWKNR